MKKYFRISNSVPVTIVALAFSVMSCFDEFDSDTYKPVFTVGGFSAVDEIQADHLVAYLPFENSLVEEVSSTEAANKATTFGNGFKGRALNLDVENESYLTLEPTADITGLTSFTISFWMNPEFVDTDANNGIDGVLGLVGLSNPGQFWGNIEWFVENNSNPDAAKIVVHIFSGGKETWVTVANFKGLFGNWTNHTLTYDETTSKFTYYINGAVAATSDAAWTGPLAFSDSGPMVIGAVQFQTEPSIGCCGKQDWASYLTGQIDELRIYDQPFTAEEVNALVILQGKGK
jgi:hypothetical protein